MSESVSEFTGKAGNIYVEKEPDRNDHPYVVWFEDLVILGHGNSELEALNDAWSHTGDIMVLISEARIKTIATTQAASVGGE